MTRIGFVGAGAGTAAAAHSLDRTLDQPSITVFEKSAGVCGRAATRRRDEVTYDYGANYLKPDDDRVVELVTETLDTAGLVNIEEPIYTFDAEGTVTEGRPADAHKWTYEQGLTQIAKRLFARTEAMVHRNTGVTAVHRDENVWHITDTAGNQWGPFDMLVLDPPAPQTAEILSNSTWNDPIRSELVAGLADIDYRTILTAIVHYPFRLDRPYYALVNPGKNHDLGWIAREECKQGHVPTGESLLVVQASPEWSDTRIDDAPEDTVKRLAELTAEVMDDEDLRDPDWTDYQGWRYALPDGRPPTDLLAAAEMDELYCVGDWTVGEPRLHAALRSGLDTAHRIASSG